MNDLAKEISKESVESAIWFLNAFGKTQEERGKLRKGLINIYGKWC